MKPRLRGVRIVDFRVAVHDDVEGNHVWSHAGLLHQREPMFCPSERSRLGARMDDRVEADHVRVKAGTLNLLEEVLCELQIRCLGGPVDLLVPAREARFAGPLRSKVATTGAAATAAGAARRGGVAATALRGLALKRGSRL